MMLSPESAIGEACEGESSGGVACCFEEIYES